jgi:hypothetical protein
MRNYDQAEIADALSALVSCGVGADRLNDEAGRAVLDIAHHGALDLDHAARVASSALLLAEQGRDLASQREDLIAQGADPQDLAVPLHPEVNG